MQNNIKNINKKIASFMLLSLALSVSVSAENASGNINTDNSLACFKSSKQVKNNVMLKYGAPQFPKSISPVTKKPIISMYAAPEIMKPPSKIVVPDEKESPKKNTDNLDNIPKTESDESNYKEYGSYKTISPDSYSSLI